MVPRALILASASPQRRALLAQIGVAFTVAPTHVEELAAGDPEQLALENARRKARAAAATAPPGTLILAVDTDVALDGRIFGKPRDASEARAFLDDLAGRTHAVWSGVVLREDGRERVTTVRTDVTFAAADPRLLDWYVATGEWEGRAGGYAIQGRGALLVDRIDGDYANVVGLPLPALRDLLGEDLLALQTAA